MPPTKIVVYCDEDGSAPVLEWLEGLADRARTKCLVALERLKHLGHELRRPQADYLRDGIYELRTALHGMQYRMLYCFCGRAVALLSHGLVKKGDKVPEKEIDLAVRRKRLFMESPERHSHKGDVV